LFGLLANQYWNLVISGLGEVMLSSDPVPKDLVAGARQQTTDARFQHDFHAMHRESKRSRSFRRIRAAEV
jgi:hypothetical protein